MPELPDVETFKAIEAGADPDAMPRSFLPPHRHAGARCPRCQAG